MWGLGSWGGLGPISSSLHLRVWPEAGSGHVEVPITLPVEASGASGGRLRALPEGGALSGQNSPWAVREEGGGEVGWAARGNPCQTLGMLGLPQAGLTPSTSPAPYFAQAAALTRMTSSAVVRGSVKTPFTMRKPRQPTCLRNSHVSQHVAGAPFSSILGPNPVGPLLHMRKRRHKMVE